MLRVNIVSLLGTSTWSPPKIPCLAKGISVGLWVDLEAAWAFGTWDSVCGNRGDFIVGCALTAAAVASYRVDPGR